MTAIDSLLGQPAAHAIGWALLQFVWQGALIGALTFLALAALKRSAADVRYLVASIGLALMLTMPVVTALQMWRSPSPSPAPSAAQSPELIRLFGPGAGLRPRSGWVSWPDPASKASGGAPVANFGRIDESRQSPHDPRSDSRWLTNGVWPKVAVTIWFIGVLALSLRLLADWFIVRRLSTVGASVASREWQELAARLARRLHIERPIRLLQSTAVEVPAVVGWLRPVVLLPVSALAGLSPSQLEAILAHELAHVRRHDYLVNLLQTLVETLLFYHPAVWWLSRRIRIERENCCDDLAVSLCGDPYAYAEALAELEQLRASGLALAASGGSLVDRVRRLVSTPSNAPGQGWLAGSAAVALIGGLAIAVAGINVVPVRATMAAGPAANEALVGVSVATNPGGGISSALVLPQAPPAPPAPPQAPAPPASPAMPVSVDSGRGRTTMRWSDGRRTLEFQFEGVVAFSDDDRDVKSMSPGSRLRIKEGGWINSRTIELTADTDGKINRRYWSGLFEKAYDPDGRAWLPEVLPDIIRRTGIGAKARVARIFTTQGLNGVLAEIDRIDGSFGKRVYFNELLQTPGIDAPATARAMAHAGKQIDSDFELATLLSDAGQRFLEDEGVRRAYVEAARSIGSDFELRRTLSAPVDRGRLSPAVLTSVLEASQGIGSDFELATLLESVAKRYPLDAVRGPYFAAVSSVGSAFEHGRVIKAVAKRTDLSDETLLETLRSAAAIKSNFECAQALTAIVAERQLSGAARDLYVRAAGRLGDFEEGQAMSALVKSERREP